LTLAEDLWEDIENLNEEEHYMGYIVLQRNEKDKNNFSVIDGQQRLIFLPSKYLKNDQQ
jgi:uncharacterized protein with ParB-like and HNH nuclease domain